MMSHSTVWPRKTVSMTVHSSNSKYSWLSTERRSPGPNVTVPWVGESCPDKILISVDFPAPLADDSIAIPMGEGEIHVGKESAFPELHAQIVYLYHSAFSMLCDSPQRIGCGLLFVAAGNADVMSIEYLLGTSVEYLPMTLLASGDFFRHP